MAGPDHEFKTKDNPIEKAYLKAIFEMTGMQRVQRASSLYESMKRMLMHQIRTAHPDLDDREIRIRVAERFYMSDPNTLELLKRARRQ